MAEVVNGSYTASRSCGLCAYDTAIYAILILSQAHCFFAKALPFTEVLLNSGGGGDYGAQGMYLLEELHIVEL